MPSAETAWIPLGKGHLSISRFGKPCSTQLESLWHFSFLRNWSQMTQILVDLHPAAAPPIQNLFTRKSRTQMHCPLVGLFILRWTPGIDCIGWLVPWIPTWLSIFLWSSQWLCTSFLPSSVPHKLLYYRLRFPVALLSSFCWIVVNDPLDTADSEKSAVSYINSRRLWKQLKLWNNIKNKTKQQQ